MQGTSCVADLIKGIRKNTVQGMLPDNQKVKIILYGGADTMQSVSDKGAEPDFSYRQGMGGNPRL